MQFTQVARNVILMNKKKKIYLQQKHTLVQIKSSFITIKNKLLDDKAHNGVAPKVNAAISE